MHTEHNDILNYCILMFEILDRLCTGVTQSSHARTHKVHTHTHYLNLQQVYEFVNVKLIRLKFVRGQTEMESSPLMLNVVGPSWWLAFP